MGATHHACIFGGKYTVPKEADGSRQMVKLGYSERAVAILATNCPMGSWGPAAAPHFSAPIGIAIRSPKRAYATEPHGI